MPKKIAYHHGAVKENALIAARELLEAGDNKALTVRAIASKLGIAHRALYNHFEDREALLVAIAADGFAELREALGRIRTPEAFLDRYVTFALNNIALYDIMMSQHYEKFESNTDLRKASEAIIDVALKCFATPALSDDERRQEVMRFWMLAHGGIGLHLSGLLKARSRSQFISELRIIAGLKSPTVGSSQALWKPSGN